MRANGVELHGCDTVREFAPDTLLATEEDWQFLHFYYPVILQFAHSLSAILFSVHI